MFVNFTSPQFKQNLNFKAKITSDDVIKTLKSLKELTAEQKINALNAITVPIKNNGHNIIDGDSLVLSALEYTPTDNVRHASSRYLTEVLRLKTYLGANKPETRKALEEMAVKTKTGAAIEKTTQMFQPTRRNIIGQAVYENNINAYRYENGLQRYPVKYPKE